MTSSVYVHKLWSLDEAVGSGELACRNVNYAFGVGARRMYAQLDALHHRMITCQLVLLGRRFHDSEKRGLIDLLPQCMYYLCDEVPLSNLVKHFLPFSQCPRPQVPT